MKYQMITSPEEKRVALVAHDNMKRKLKDWVEKHLVKLSQHELYATGTTGTMLNTELDLKVNPLLSGPLGGDQEIGAMIAHKEIDILIFFWDPLQAQPHDPDVKALLRLAAVWNVPVACNPSSADLFINSSLFDAPLERSVPDYEAYRVSRSGE